MNKNYKDKAEKLFDVFMDEIDKNTRFTVCSDNGFEDKDENGWYSQHIIIDSLDGLGTIHIDIDCDKYDLGYED